MIHSKIRIALSALITLSCAPLPVHSQTRYEGEVFQKVRITRDLAYKACAENGKAGVRCLLDVYEPEGDEEPLRPLMVWVHGGGFRSGSKTARQIVELCTHFARCGFVCVSINYTLRLADGGVKRTEDSLREAVSLAAEDARSALCYLASHRDRFRMDVSRVSIGGSSAGAFTALLAGCGGAEACGVNIRAIIDLWGGLLDMSVMRAGGPPILAMHGTEDKTVPFTFAELLAERGMEVETYVELHPLSGEGHGPWSYMQQFLDWIHEFARGRLF